MFDGGFNPFAMGAIDPEALKIQRNRKANKENPKNLCMLYNVPSRFMGNVDKLAGVYFAEALTESLFLDTFNYELVVMNVNVGIDFSYNEENAVLTMRDNLEEIYSLDSSKNYIILIITDLMHIRRESYSNDPETFMERPEFADYPIHEVHLSGTLNVFEIYEVLKMKTETLFAIESTPKIPDPMDQPVEELFDEYGNYIAGGSPIEVIDADVVEIHEPVQDWDDISRTDEVSDDVPTTTEWTDRDCMDCNE